MVGHRRQLFFWATLGFCLIGLSLKLKALKGSSADAWEKMKKDFWESYESLKDSIQSTEEEVTYI